MFEKLSSRFQTFKRFYIRNDSLFACIGLFIGGHIVWWQIQQNKNLVPRDKRLKHIGPFAVPYLDDIQHQKKLKAAEETSDK